MAFYDDTRFLLSHIRNSYITSDDTGICEMVMLNEDCPPKAHQSSLHPSWTLDSSDSGLESDAAELSQSCDIVSDMDYSLRRRSNTAQKLDKLKKERKNQAKITNVTWQKSLLSDEDRSKLFEKRANTIPKVATKAKRSLLSEQLEKFPTVPNNPFSEYAKFDGNAYIGIATKKLNIYLTVLTSADDRAFPMTVVTVITTRVQDLIGLICWQYTKEERQPPLKKVDCYSLCIAEENGEVDLDFPSLDPKEAISKFGFTDLALVEKNLSDGKADDQIIVTVNIQGGFSKIPVESMNTQMKEILDSTLRRRRGMVKQRGLDYQLEKAKEPGIAIDLEATLASMETLAFFLVRENSKRDDDSTDGSKPFTSWPFDKIAMEALSYQSFRVSLIRKVFTKTEIQLGISGEKIEIDPVKQQGSVKFLIQPQKPVTHDIDTIAACEMIDEKYTGYKAAFRLIYRSDGSHDFRHHDCEAERSVSFEIVRKITHILELRPSTVRSDYLASKEGKHKRKSSISSSSSTSSAIWHRN